jgi:hypothetical protein
MFRLELCNLIKIFEVAVTEKANEIHLGTLWVAYANADSSRGCFAARFYISLTKFIMQLLWRHFLLSSYSTIPIKDKNQT